MSKPEKSGDCITALAMAWRIKTVAWNHVSRELQEEKGRTSALLSALSIPMKACKKPMIMTISKAKKINDSFIMTFSTTNIAPKKRIESRYKRSLIQNIGAEKAITSN